MPAGLQDDLTQKQEEALSLSAEDVQARSHVQCCVVSEPLQEAHTVKLLCEVQSLKMPASQADAAVEGTAPGSAIALGEDAAPGSCSTTEALTVESQVYVVVESAVGGFSSLPVGASFFVLQPWEVLTLAADEVPVLVALVAVPFPP